MKVQRELGREIGDRNGASEAEYAGQRSDVDDQGRKIGLCKRRHNDLLLHDIGLDAFLRMSS